MVNHHSPDLIVGVGALLGESPRWFGRRGRLLWLDIDRGILHETDTTGHDVGHHVGRGVGAIAPVAGAGVALARRDAFLVADLETRRTRRLAEVPSAADEVMNDGACDPAGRFLAGTYAEGELPGRGRLYRLGLDGSVCTVLDSVTLSNGLGWSPDERRMYYIDSATQGIDVFDYDRDTGAISARRRLVTISTDDGLPDGLAVDDAGGVWIALWGGAEVRRYTPAGQLDAVVELPTDHVTACAFGGARGETLFVTTAAGYLDDRQRASQPHAGGLFAIAPGVSGPAAQPLAM